MSDDTPMQTDIFGGETPMAAPVEGPTPVPRRAGWYLVATHRQAPRYWHEVLTGTAGQVVTRCGLRGRTVPDTQREIMPCPDCEAAQ